MAVNALGDIYDWKNGKKVAGLLAKDKKSFLCTEDEVYKSYEVVKNKFVANTTIGAVITNAAFHKTQLCKIASMTHNGYARSIRPVHTTADGDSIYALSTGTLEADLDMVGTLAAQVMSEAILRAVMSAETGLWFSGGQGSIKKKNAPGQRRRKGSQISERFYGNFTAVSGRPHFLQ